MSKLRELHSDVEWDFDRFWDFWQALDAYATDISDVKPGADGVKRLPPPNKMMVAAYAAGAWFHHKGFTPYSQMHEIWLDEDWTQRRVNEVCEKYERRLDKFRAENRKLKQRIKRAEKAKARKGEEKGGAL